MRMPLAVAVLFMASAPLAAADEKPPDERPPREFEIKLKPVEIADGDSQLVKLQKERYNAALTVVKLRLLRVAAGKDTLVALGDTFERLVDAGLEVLPTPKERHELLERAVEAAKQMERIVTLLHKEGRISTDEFEQARFVRLSAEIRLLKEKEHAKK
jgi:uncharacterized protein related to proFAR isomerase